MYGTLTIPQIPISATYIPSVFGSCIESLVFLYRPLQDAPVAQLIDIVSNDSFFQLIHIILKTFFLEVQ